MADTGTIIIGAGPAGLACAAALGDAGGSAIVLDSADRVGASWRRHYDRLHLHTPRSLSGLPGLPLPADSPTYPSRDQFVAYLDAYAAHHRIALRFGTRVARVTRAAGDWIVETGQGPLTAPNVVFATGIASWPFRRAWPGIDSFPGPIIHSSDYRNPTSLPGQRVLVVGFGNSAGEIAMELADAGREVWMSIRGPVNVVPRDLFGVPVLWIALFERFLPPRLADTLNAPVLRLAVGNLRKLKIKPAARGALTMAAQEHRIPMLDIGTLARIRAGRITPQPGVMRITGAEVAFDNGLRTSFDAILMATGFRTDLRPLLPDHADVLDRYGAPLRCGQPTTHSGLFFCGQIPVATGQLRQIGIEATRIARLICASS